MGFFDRFRKPQASSPSTGETLLDNFLGQPIHYDIRRLSPAEMWSTQPHLRTVVSFLARNIAQLGLHSFERVDETDRRRDRESAVAKVLLRPNSETTAYELIFSLVGDLALYDLAYWHVAPDADAPSGWSIVRIPPEWVTPRNADAFRRKAYIVKAPGGDPVEFPATEILPFHGYNPTDPRDGSTAISALKGVLQEQLQSSMYRQQVWKNGGRVSAVLNRPKDAPGWSPEARDRFREDWYSTYTGNGARAGGTPILEDGMTLQKIDFSATEQQYVEGAKLSFATVCSAYHVNPTMVGLLDNANYSNVREFRRMLYGDTLGPLLAQIEARLNAFLLPLMGVDAEKVYLEFNLAEKLQGSFEEQAAVMSTLVGRPVMSADEGRARFNLPAMGGDAAELVTPLNVLIGGQASPRDSGSQNEKPKSRVEFRGEKSDELFVPSSPGRRLVMKARAPETHEDKFFEVLAKFFNRQERAVKSLLGAGAADWWDTDRWNKELAEDLWKLAVQTSETVAADVLKQLALDPDAYDTNRTLAFLSAVAERQAADINAVTEQQVADALDDEEDADAAVDNVFAVSKDSRAKQIAISAVTFASGFAAEEAAKQGAGGEAWKTWDAGSNPRSSHARLDGESVRVGEKFSNGALWPGDGSLPVQERANCNCSMRIELL